MKATTSTTVRGENWLRNIALATISVMVSAPCAAHGFAQRYDLPVPLWLYLSGAAATVIVSFVVIALFVRRGVELYHYPRFNLLSLPFVALLSRRVILVMAQLLSVGLFTLVLVAGWFGVQEPFYNIAPTTVWVIWWVGLAYLSGLVGNLWVLINPWSNIYAAIEYLLSQWRPGCQSSLLLPLPSWLGVWPSVVLFTLFAWLELVWRDSDVPANIATAVLGYSLITWTGMVLFGREIWLRHGEVFSLVFGLLSRFAPTELRVNGKSVCATCSSSMCNDGEEDCINCTECFRRASAATREWNLRPFGVGLLTVRSVSFSLTFFVVLMLATVTFDGFMATPLWAETVQWALYFQPLRPLLVALQPLFGDALTVISSLGMGLFSLMFVVIYLLFCILMKWAVGSVSIRLSTSIVAGNFVLTLIPIALAYHLAHYLSYLLIVGQYMIPLISDPFGYGWDLFGTKLYFINIGIINARWVWIISVIAIVVGHIFAVFLAHVMAQRVFRDPQLVLRSQIPLLILMVGYTMVSLWILAQPIVE